MDVREGVDGALLLLAASGARPSRGPTRACAARASSTWAGGATACASTPRMMASALRRRARWVSSWPMWAAGLAVGLATPPLKRAAAETGR